jgi:hypothetical protein
MGSQSILQQSLVFTATLTDVQLPQYTGWYNPTDHNVNFHRREDLKTFNQTCRLEVAAEHLRAS